MLKIGTKVPEFTLNNQDGKPVSLSDFLGKKVVLYFYPKDLTSGCTAEACDFRDNLANFNQLKTVVLGVSPDDEKSHTKFIAKEGLNFDLLSDPDKLVCQVYDVWKEKSMYGRKYMGVERSTFLIDEAGNLLKEWRKVSVPGHIAEIKSTLES